MTYLEKTHRPMNCLVVVLPLLAAYEAWAATHGGSGLALPVWINNAMGHFGASWQFLPAALVAGVLLSWQFVSREDWTPDGDAVAGIVGEGLLWSVPLFAIWLLIGRVFSAPALQAQLAPAAAAAPRDLAGGLLIGVGAAVYEEFLFRLVLVGGLMALLVTALKANKPIVLVAAAILSAVAFGLAHPPEYRVFYAVAGAYLAAVFVARGLGVAVGVHACYNVILALTAG